MLNFHKSLSFLNWLFPLLPVPQDFPTRFSSKIFLQDFPKRFSRKIFPQDFPARFSCKIFPSWILIGWLPITLFQMINFHQSLPFLNWLFPLLPVPQDFPTRFSHKIFQQEFPTGFSCKIFPQDFPELDPDWLAPHHPIPNAKFPQITVFLKLAFPLLPVPQDFPARFSCKIFPQDFPKLDPDWLANHHPIPNAKFSPITALLNMPTYHKSAKVSPPPFPQSHGNPKSMNKLTLNEPAINKL